jgi:hypothetical protein
MKNRYLLFWSNSYTGHPNGGMNDFKGSFESLELAIDSCREMFEDRGVDFAHIFDLLTMQVVKEYVYDYKNERTDWLDKKIKK